MSNEKNMKTFKELANESDGQFSIEPNDKIEIHVNLCKSEIRVEIYRTANHMVNVPEEDWYFSLYGMMGYPSIEEKFNEIISNLPVWRGTLQS